MPDVAGEHDCPIGGSGDSSADAVTFVMSNAPAPRWGLHTARAVRVPVCFPAAACR